jgi:hypothetical protein
MQKWEYMVLQADTPTRLGEFLKRWGDEGWEAISMESFTFWGGEADVTELVVLLKRPKH